MFGEPIMDAHPVISFVVLVLISLYIVEFVVWLGLGKDWSLFRKLHRMTLLEFLNGLQSFVEFTTLGNVKLKRWELK